MHTTSTSRPFQVLLAVTALVLAGIVGAAMASAGGSPAKRLTAAPADTLPVVTDISGAGTADQLLAAALSEPALGADPTGGAAPSNRPAAGTTRGAGILRAIVGRTDRAQIDVSTATGEQTILYVRGTIASVSATSITITLRDGTTQAYAIDATTRIRAAGKQAAVTDLATGETALVLGLKSGDTYTARIIRGRPQVKAPAGS
jgi:hypothetical protein